MFARFPCIPANIAENNACRRLESGVTCLARIWAATRGERVESDVSKRGNEAAMLLDKHVFKTGDKRMVKALFEGYKENMVM